MGRNFDQHEMCGKGQKYALQKDFERCYAFDCGEDPPFQVTGQSRGRRRTTKKAKRTKCSKAIRREIVLSFGLKAP